MKGSLVGTVIGGDGKSEENVKVAVRVRPLSQTEIDKKYETVVEVDEDNCVISVRPAQSQSSQKSGGGGGGEDGANPGNVKSYRFDQVFPTTASQVEVYNKIARPIVDNVVGGYNGTIFAYGQTGTGKTYTMEGDNTVPELKGIIPNSFAQIFNHISTAPPDNRYLVRVSYMEIYNEEIRDLLKKDSTKRLELKERPETGVFVKDLSSIVVRNADDMDQIMGLGNKNRSVASTNMNLVSSRSHAIFTINVECSTEKEKGKNRSLRMGKLNLVDLAGSERLSKTGATGDRLKEATKINLSLSNLGNVISALVDGSSHIPYRNSKLTRLLQDSLGGNAKTVMCANVGPAAYNLDETVNTLRYASRAKKIRNFARINEDPKDALLRKFEAEIEELRRQIMLENSHNERNSENDDGENGGGGGLNQNNQTTEEEWNSRDVTSLLDDETLNEITKKIASHEQIGSKIGSAKDDKKKVITQLKQNMETWKIQQEQKNELTDRMKNLKKKILVGGVNLLDKSKEQEELLLSSMKAIEEGRQKHEQMIADIKAKEAYKLELEEKLRVLTEKNGHLDKKLRKQWTVYKQVKAEADQRKLELSSETGIIREQVERMEKEVEYLDHVVDTYIPREQYGLIESNSVWNVDSSEWSLKCIAYAGNNIQRERKERPPRKDRRVPLSACIDLSFLCERFEDELELGGKSAQNICSNNSNSANTNAKSKRKVSVLYTGNQNQIHNQNQNQRRGSANWKEDDLKEDLKDRDRDLSMPVSNTNTYNRRIQQQQQQPGQTEKIKGSRERSGTPLVPKQRTRTPVIFHRQM